MTNNPPDTDNWGTPYQGKQDESIVHHTYTRHAHTVMALLSGGRAIPGRQILHEISGWVKDVAPTFGLEATPPSIVASRYYDAYPLSLLAWQPNVPFAAVRIGGLGTLHDDPNWPPSDPFMNPDNPQRGTLCCVTAAGAKPILCTPSVSGHNFYTWNLNEQHYQLRIRANNAILQPDAIAPNANFCVGQKVNFSPDWLPGEPPGIHQKWPILWAFDGTFVNTNVPPQYSDGCPDYYIEDPDYLHSETTHAWWVSGGYNPAIYMANFGEGLTFDNGQYVVVTTRGQFSMHRPRLLNYTLLPAPCNPNPDTGDLEHDHYFGASPSDQLQDGGPYGPASNPLPESQWGYAPSYQVDVDSKFGGSAYVTQLVNGYETNTVLGINTQGTNELDNSDPYINPGPIMVTAGSSSNVLGLNDGPGLPCDGHTAQNLHFTDYIRFQPSGGIPVTLGTVSWYVIDSTDFDTTNDYTPILPTSAITNPYLMPTGSAHVDSSITDSEAFPYWDHTAKNK